MDQTGCRRRRSRSANGTSSPPSRRRRATCASASSSRVSCGSAPRGRGRPTRKRASSPPTRRVPRPEDGAGDARRGRQSFRAGHVFLRRRAAPGHVCAHQARGKRRARRTVTGRGRERCSCGMALVCVRGGCWEGGGEVARGRVWGIGKRCLVVGNTYLLSFVSNVRYFRVVRFGFILLLSLLISKVHLYK